MPALIAISSPAGYRKTKLLVRGLKTLYAPAARTHDPRPLPVIAGAVCCSSSRCCCSRGWARSSSRRSTRRISRCMRMRIPSTALRSRRRCSSTSRRRSADSAGRVCVLEDGHGRDGNRSDAAERVRHLHHSEAAARNGRIRGLTKESSDRTDRSGGARACPATTMNSRSRSRCASTS